MWNPTHNMQARIKFCFLLHPVTPGKPIEWITWLNFYQIALGWHSDLSGLQLVPPWIQVTLKDHLTLSTELMDFPQFQSWSLQVASGLFAIKWPYFTCSLHYCGWVTHPGSTQPVGAKWQSWGKVPQVWCSSSAVDSRCPRRVWEYNKHIMILLIHNLPASSDSWARLFVFNSTLGFVPHYCLLILLYFQYALSALRRFSFLYSYTAKLLRLLGERLCVNAPFISCSGLWDVLICGERCKWEQRRCVYGSSLQELVKFLFPYRNVVSAAL